MTPTWRGSRNVTEVPDSPDILYSNDKDTCTRVFHGPYADVMRAVPLRGQSMRGIPAAFTVETVRVVHAKGGKGIMTVTLNAAPTTSSSNSDSNNPVTEPEVEIDNVQLERPIEKHPRYKTVTEDDLALISEYFSASKDRRAAIMRFFSGSADHDLALELLKHKIRGVESYLLFPPVVKRTAEYRRLPATEKCGAILTASALKAKLNGEPVPSGFEYMKTSDRASRTGRHGRYKRTEEWTGAQVWDRHLYVNVPAETPEDDP